jgi:transposase
VSKLRESIEGPDADAREAALLAVAQLPAAAGRAAEPYLLPLVPLLLEKAADKAGPARDAAAAAAVAAARALCPHAAEMVLPTLFAHTDASKKWQTREAALRMLAAVAETAPRQVAACLPEIVPLIATLMVDPREQVGVKGGGRGKRGGRPGRVRRRVLRWPAVCCRAACAWTPADSPHHPSSPPLAAAAAPRSRSRRWTRAPRATTSWATATSSTWWVARGMGVGL